MSDSMKVNSKLNKKVIVAAAGVIVVALALVLAVTVPKRAEAKRLAEQLDLGEKYLSELDYEQAAAAYLKAIEIDPKCEDAYLALADIYIATGELEKAEEILKKAERELGGATEKVREKTEEMEDAKRKAEVTPELTPTNTPEPTPTHTPEPIPTNMPAPTDEPNPIGEAEPTPTNEPEATLSGMPTPTNTPIPASTNTPAAAEKITGISKEDAVVGNIVSFGIYEQDNNLSNGLESIEWVVLAVENDRALLLSEYGLDAIPYHEKNEACTWETSTIRKWLNSEFFNMAFREEEQQFIQTVTVSTSDVEYSGLAEGNDTQDKIFLLSKEEVEYYRPIGEKSPATTATAYAWGNGVLRLCAEDNQWTYRNCAWWLRSSAFITEDGTPDSGYLIVAGSSDNRVEKVINSSNCVAVRPALWVIFDDKAEPQEIAVPESTETSVIKDIAEKEIQTGDIVLFGAYEQDGIAENGNEQIEWIVLGVEDKKALLLSRFLLDMQAYVEFNEDEGFGERRISWETSSLREWLNKEFYNIAFTNKDKETVLRTTINDEDGANTLDYVFLLSIEEANQYFPQDGYLLDEGRLINRHRVAIPTKKANMYNGGEDGYYAEKDIRWFLRSQGDDAYAVSYVNQNGIIVDFGIWIGSREYVRPAVWVDLSVIGE